MGNANHSSGCGKDKLIQNATCGPPLLFHQTHSPSIRLSIDCRLAKRFEGTKGICFSNRPVRVGELIALKILETANSRNGALRFGLACEDPESIESEELAQYASPDLTCEQGYWAKGIPERLVQRGNVLGFWLAPEGEVHYGCNGNRHGVFFQGVDVKCPLWALLDVFGSTISVSIIDVEQPILNNVEMPRATSASLKNATPSLSRNSSSSSVPLPARSQSTQPHRSSRDLIGPLDAPTSSHTSPLDCNRETRSAGSTPTITSNLCTTKNLPNRILQDFGASRNPWNHLEDPGVSQRLHEPMPFHYAIGRNICLSSDRTIATRLSEDYCNGYVFTSRPIRPGEKLIIEVAAVDLDYVGGLAFGMTACDPAEVRVTELPDDSDQLLDRPEYWVVHKDVCVKPEVGDRLTFYLTRKGEVRFSRNCCPVAMLMHVDISLELWAFIDVYGTTQRIKSCGVTSRVLTTKNLKAPFGDPGCQFAKSLGRLNLTSPLRQLQSQSTVETGAANGYDPLTRPARNLKTCSDRLTEMQQVMPKDTWQVSPQHTFNPFCCDVSADRRMIDHPVTTSVNRRTASVLSRGLTAPPISDPFFDVPVTLPPPLIPVPAPNLRLANFIERPQPTLSADAALDFDSSPQLPENAPTLDEFWSTGGLISGSPNCREILRNFQEPAEPIKVSSDISEQAVHSSKNSDSESSASECAVCWEKVPDCALYTCGHMCMCYECAINVLKKQGALCPICRQPVRDVIRIFKS